MNKKVKNLTDNTLTVEQLKKDWYAVYKYLLCHTVDETTKYFGMGIIDIIRNK